MVLFSLSDCVRWEPYVLNCFYSEYSVIVLLILQVVCYFLLFIHNTVGSSRLTKSGWLFFVCVAFKSDPQSAFYCCKLELLPQFPLPRFKNSENFHCALTIAYISLQMALAPEILGLIQKFATVWRFLVP